MNLGPRKAQSGYVNCACRDCMEIAVANDVRRGALCRECEEHGCAPERDGGGECLCPCAYTNEEVAS